MPSLLEKILIGLTDSLCGICRDKIMIHSDLPWTGIRRSPVIGIQFARDSMLSGSNLGAEAELMISLKNGNILKNILNYKKSQTIYGI